MSDLTTATHQRVRTSLVFRPRHWAIFAVLTAANLGVLLWYFDRWFGYGDIHRHPLQTVVLSASLVIAFGMYETRWLTMPLMRRPHPMPAVPGYRVGVATTFVPSAEPIEMLEETVAAMVALDYPHDTWVLDEGDDPAVKALCERLGAHHFSRKGREEYQTASGTFEQRSKHGNYNAWFDAVAYEAYDVVVGFDPDHVPNPDFLLRMLGYLEDPEVGYVQAPQLYYNQPANFIARGAAEETYTYYSSVQLSSYGLGYPIVTGCHHVHRVTALREVGGFAAHEADDLLITILYRAAGWRGVYVPELLAQGITPVDWNGYLTQQRRWARSVLDVKIRVFPKVAGRLPFLERITSMLHGLYYLHGLATLLGLLLLAWTLVSGSGSVVWGHMWKGGLWGVALVFLCCDAFRQRFFLVPREEWGIHWRAGLLRQAKWPSVLLALIDASRPRRQFYTITAKRRQQTRDALLRVPHTIVVVVLGAAMLVHPRLDTVHAVASFTVLMSLCLLATTFRGYPQPYERELSETRRARPYRLNAVLAPPQDASPAPAVAGEAGVTAP